jgi:hypothetical protein
VRAPTQPDRLLDGSDPDSRLSRAGDCLDDATMTLSSPCLKGVVLPTVERDRHAHPEDRRRFAPLARWP